MYAYHNFPDAPERFCVHVVVVQTSMSVPNSQETTTHGPATVLITLILILRAPPESHECIPRSRQTKWCSRPCSRKRFQSPVRRRCRRMVVPTRRLVCIYCGVKSRGREPELHVQVAVAALVLFRKMCSEMNQNRSQQGARPDTKHPNKSVGLMSIQHWCTRNEEST